MRVMVTAELDADKAAPQWMIDAVRQAKLEGRTISIVTLGAKPKKKAVKP